MVWYIFAILGAFFDAAYSASIKKFLGKTNQYVLASGVFLSVFLILFLTSLINGLPVIKTGFYLAVLGTGIINVVTLILFYKALKITDLSLAMPMIAFTPIFLILTSLIMLGESPTTIGILGILLVVIGSYILKFNKKEKGIFAPFKSLITNKGTLFMLIVAFLYSFSTNFDKLVVLNSDTVFGASIVCLFIGLTFLLISIARKEVKFDCKINWYKFLLAGFFFALSVFLINMAYLSEIVPYVISLKRLAILFSVFFGGVIFKEKFLLRRGIAALIMVAGAVLIIVS